MQVRALSRENLVTLGTSRVPVRSCVSWCKSGAGEFGGPNIKPGFSVPRVALFSGAYTFGGRAWLLLRELLLHPLTS